jgi:hypothetical protein
MEQPDKTSEQADESPAERAERLCKRLADPATTEDERDAIQRELLNYGLARIFAD